MELAVSSWSLRSHINNTPPWLGQPRAETDMSIDEFPGRVREMFGVGAVEICQMHVPWPDVRGLDRVAAGLDAAGVRVVNVPIDVGDISQPDDAKREHDLKLIQLWIDAAAYLGSPAARVNSGSGDLETAIHSYRRLAEYAAGKGVRLVIENHGGLSADLANLRRMLDEAGPNFGTSPDFGNFDESVRYDGLALMAPHAAVVHAKTYDFDERGEFHGFDLARCLGIVRDAGYDGPLSVEFEGDGDQPDGVRRTIALLRTLEPSLAAA